MLIAATLAISAFVMVDSAGNEDDAGIPVMGVVARRSHGKVAGKTGNTWEKWMEHMGKYGEMDRRT